VSGCHDNVLCEGVTAALEREPLDPVTLRNHSEARRGGARERAGQGV